MAPAAHVNASEYDFPKAFAGCFGYSVYNLLKRTAGCTAADERNDAEAAKVVAAILDFNHGTGAKYGISQWIAEWVVFFFPLTVNNFAPEMGVHHPGNMTFGFVTHNIGTTFSFELFTMAISVAACQNNKGIHPIPGDTKGLTGGMTAFPVSRIGYGTAIDDCGIGGLTKFHNLPAKLTEGGGHGLGFGLVEFAAEGFEGYTPGGHF